MLKISLAVLVILLPVVCFSCYRMPSENEYRLVPTTNNPAVTREKDQGPIPQLSY